MKNKTLHIIFLFILFYGTGNYYLFASAADSIQESMPVWDQSKVDYRRPTSEKMQAYRQMDEYIYDRYQQPETWWQKFKRWAFNHILKFISNAKGISYVFISIAVILVVLVILKLLGVEISGLFIFSKSVGVSNLSFGEIEDDIHNENLDNLLSISIKNNAYREATRILYLICLRELNQKEKILWKPWKTNRDFYYEIKEKKEKDQFKQLIRNYEYVWYGQFPINKKEFSDIKANFSSFNKAN